MTTDDKKRNVYVIDANVFIGADISPFRSFRDAIIIVPMHVLDALEKRIDDRDQGWACKAVINYIERLRASEKDGDKLTTTGVMDKNGNIVIVATTPRTTIGMTHSQMTIKIAKEQQDKRPGQQVTLISNTLSTRVRADEAGLSAEPFAGSFKLFDGRIDNIDVRLGSSGDITRSKTARNEALKDVDRRCRILDMPTPSHAVVTLGHRCRHEPSIFLKRGDEFIGLRSMSAGNVRPRTNNVDQTIAMQYLMDPDITAVSLGGVAGGGKSFLALASAIAQTSGRNDALLRYGRIIAFRSMIEVAGQEVGFLPGELSNKMQPWAQAIWDNVDQIDRINGLAKKKDRHIYDETDDSFDRANQEHYPAKKRGQKPILTPGEVGTGNIIDTPQLRHPEISIEPVSYLRGRTFNDTFIIVDDAQSLERSTILSIITRLGRGSKIVFTYDMSQQDNRFISRGTSILSVISDLMQRPEFAHVSFTKSERSALAQFAADLLTADAA